MRENTDAVPYPPAATWHTLPITTYDIVDPHKDQQQYGNTQQQCAHARIAPHAKHDASHERQYVKDCQPTDRFLQDRH